MLHMSKTIPPPPNPSRVSVPVDAETLAVFQRLGKAANLSTGKAIAEWLRDTVEAAELMASTVERARAAPKVVTAELHAMMLGMADQSKELADKYAKFRGAMPDTGAGAARPGPEAPTPPSCNTGGKVPTSKNPMTGNSGSLPKAKKPVFPMKPAMVQAYADTNGIPPKAKK